MATSSETRVYVGRARDAVATIGFGLPDAVAVDGPLRTYAPARVVAYRIAGPQLHWCYVFRTLDAVEREREGGGARVPGVSPNVRLFFEAAGQSRGDRIVRLLRIAHRETGGADGIEDDFFVRLATANWRLSPHELVQALLRGAEPKAVVRSGSRRRPLTTLQWIEKR